jgi:hypothetical protein
MQPLRIAGHALAASALLLAAACGDDDDSSAADDTTTTSTSTTVADRTAQDVDEDVIDRIADAVDATIAEGTARFTVTVETEGTGTGGDGEQPIEAEGEVDFDDEMRLLTIVGPEGNLEVVIDGDTAYLELPATEGDDWMRIDLSALFDEDLGMGGPAGIPFQDPTNNLRLLGGSALHAQEAGEETIDGTDTTRYELVIDIEDAATEASQEVQDAVEATAERTGLTELAMEVWIDDDDLIRRVAYTLDLDQAEVTETDDDTDSEVVADPEGSVTVTVEYRDFGATLDIEVPDEDDVIDLDEDAVRSALGGDRSDSGGTTTTSTTTDSDDDSDDDDDSDTTTTSAPTTSTTTEG